MDAYYKRRFKKLKQEVNQTEKDILKGDKMQDKKIEQLEKKLKKQ